MKKSMPEYIKTLSDDEFEILEEIFEDKYLKFIQLYWLICEYSDYITSLSYKKTNKDKLKISVQIHDLDTEALVDHLIEVSEEQHNVLIYEDDKKIFIEITKDESKTPLK